MACVYLLVKLFAVICALRCPAKEAQYFTGQKNQPLLADPRFGPMPMPYG